MPITIVDLQQPIDKEHPLVYDSPKGQEVPGG
jgi:hypothetical protein